LIPDTLADPIFRDVPTVQSLGARAYAGIPLIMENGHAIGSFCAIDFAPREWSALDVEVLTELAAAALREIKLRGALTEAEAQTQVAREATRSREEVRAIVAHDLRTPLNFIKMGTQLVAEVPTARENKRTAQANGNRSRSDVATDRGPAGSGEARSGGVKIQAIPLGVMALLADARAMLQPLAARHSIRLSVKAEAALPAVLVDYERILRVFSNLVVNAVKFSVAGAEVRVSAARHGETVRFSVIDIGEGIRTEHLEQIFDRFWQADAKDRRGAGLGLAIAKAIIGAHGGIIGVTSVLGQGSEFYFELPIA